VLASAGQGVLVLLPDANAVRLDRARERSHSARVQNCCNWLVMAAHSELESNERQALSVGDETSVIRS